MAGAIRRQSTAGMLVTPEEIFDVLRREGRLAPERDRHEWDNIPEDLIGEEKDIKRIVDQAGKPYYYSARYLNEAYALILLKRKDNVLELMAEIVRENSRVYPRPVPLNLFMDPPFSMSPAEIDACRKKMAESKDYGDIAGTITSTGTTFFYSTLYLKPSHAEYLAEWLDVGQSENP